MKKETQEAKRVYKVGNKDVEKTNVKSAKEDKGGKFYVFDMFGVAHECLAKNRYCMKNSEEQPFEELTDDEELELNPPVVESDEFEQSGM